MSINSSSRILMSLLSLYIVQNRVKTFSAVALSIRSTITTNTSSTPVFATTRCYASSIDASFESQSQTFASEYHAPVMYRECISSMLECERGRLRSEKGGNDERLIFVDGTLGGGGHSTALLQSMQPQDILVGCDRDPTALKTASERLEKYIAKGMFIPHQSNFRDLASSLKSVRNKNGDLLWSKNDDVAVDGLILDLGVSSHQIDCADRGFSYSKNGRLDMRMDSSERSSQALTAADICNEWDERSLSGILKTYGDEPRAKKIAHSIINRRPYKDTSDLVDAVKAVTPEFVKHNRRLGQTATLARVFQSLRMVVNEEDTSLSDALVVAAPVIVRQGGRLVVLTYHSLEDRATKRVMKDGHERWLISSNRYSHALIDKKAKPLAIEKDLYGNELGPQKPWKMIGKLRKAKDDEIEQNNRARSATLRVAERQSCTANRYI